MRPIVSSRISSSFALTVALLNASASSGLSSRTRAMFAFGAIQNDRGESELVRCLPLGASGERVRMIGTAGVLSRRLRREKWREGGRESGGREST